MTADTQPTTHESHRGDEHMSEEGTVVERHPAEVATSLSRGTNWWGAFVIGLAGTILVTGIVPFAVSSMGAAAIPAIALVVSSG